MRNAYVIVGIAGLIVFAGAAYAFNRSFTQPGDTVYTEAGTSNSMTTSTFTLTSSAFTDNASIPPQFTCDGDRSVSPALSITGVPEGTKSLALIMDDPDVPKALHADGVFDHWVLFNIPADTREIPEGGSVGVAGANGAGKNAYTGPCPPPQYEPSEHRYIFKLYALDSELALQAGASKADVEKAMEGHIIAETRLTGRYKRI
ncbi:MAG: YbhB/YbcL family Raf kinase inhibitor-like protein [Patescibacteria group bacterium]